MSVRCCVSKLTLVVSVLLLVGLVATGTLAAPFTENFAKGINQTYWVVDNDSGYEVSVSGGVLKIKGGPEGSGGPCDGIASYAYGTNYSFEINPVKLKAGEALKDNQMGVVYLAQNEQRGGPVVAYGFIADPDKAGKVALAWLTSTPAEWQVLKSGLDANKWYKLSCKVLKDTDQVELYFEGKLVDTVDNAYADESPKLVLRSGSWDGTNEDVLEVLYRNIKID